ncbi:MAG: PAS domain S-box protein [Nitrospirae bacterium]|nr:PAS domain S-box protein [Nitrospirota bacterium]
MLISPNNAKELDRKMFTSKRRLSLKLAIGEEQLKDIQDSYLQYIESSASIYEVNGDYAVSLFTSGWCDFLNQASMRLCSNVSEEEALKSGKWICHEDCWATSLKSIKEKRPFEMECSGGIAIYAAPIIADGMVIGSNNAGISNPPTDENKIRQIADIYKVSPVELLRLSKQYTPRPEYVFNACRKHITIAASTIANIFLRNQEKEELIWYEEHIEELVKERTSTLQREIEERTNVDKELSAERNKLKSIIDAMEHDVIIQDLEYNIVYQSEKVGSLFGERLGEKCYQVFEGNDKICDGCPVQMAFKDGASHTSVRKVLTPNGKTAFFENTANPIRDANGNIVSCLEIVRDITERQLLEDKLKETREQLQSIIDNTTAVIFLKDTEGRYLLINRQYEELFHITKFGIIGKTDYDVFPKELADNFRENDMTVLNGMRPMEFEEIVPHDDGLHTYISMKFVLLDVNGNPYGVCGVATDITNYKRLSESLKLSSLYNRSLIEASLDPLVTITTYGKIGDVNTATETVTGYSRYELIGTDFSDYFTEPDTARIGYQAVFEYGRVQDYELFIRHRNGHITPVLYNASVYKDETGKVIGIFAAARDITKLKLKEQSLIQAKNDWEMTFNTIPDLLMILDSNHKIMKINETMAKKLNINPEEAIGKICHEVVHSTDKPLDICSNQNLIEEGIEHTIEIYEERLNGYFMVTKTPLRNPDGTPYGLIHLARDVSHMKYIQNQLFTENEKTKAILMAIGDGVTIQDTSYRIAYQNQVVKDIFGDRIGEYCYRVYENNDQVCDGCPVREVFKDGDIHRSIRRVVKHDGNTAYFSVIASPIRDASGSIASAIEIARDITDEKMAEEALKASEEELQLKTYTLRRLNENLESLVKNKVEEIRRKEQLLIQQSKMAAMGEMIGAIAHQWRQPLNGLGLMIQDLKDAYEFGELDANYIDDTVTNAMKQIEFMSKTIDEFRNFFKPSKKKETFDLLEISSEVFSMLSSQFKTNSISYSLTCHIHNKTYRDCSMIMPCNDTLITTYKNQLAHVMLNLITNAKDAIIERRENGLLTTAGMIAVDCFKDDRTLRVEISDNGGGIPEDVIDKMFELYFTTKADKGTGIGLYMSKIIIEESLGGKLYAKTTGEGSIFTIEFGLERV